MNGFSEKVGEVSESDETTTAEQRGKLSASEKERIVEASLQPGASVKAVAEAHGVHPTQVSRWRGQYGRKREGESGAALLPVRVTEESVQHSRPTRSVTIHLEFLNARVRIESADRATVLAILERLAR
jgi:transposase-like protein